MGLSAGSRLGPYEILAPLGAGGMGEVYRARDPRLGREVAVKVLPEDVSRDGERLRRFEQEARAAGALNHPSILTVHDVGNHDGRPYVVSELLEGQTLREAARQGGLTVRKVLDHAIQIAQGLFAAHEKGIVHRDLKPDNLFLTWDGRVKILDFGLAKLTRPEASDSRDTDTASARESTESGTVLGTVGYMSPEQVRGLSADHRSDVFSFGTVLFELLSGKHPFRADTAAETMTAILREDPPELSGAVREIPPPLERIVRRCLEKRPEDRFHSAHDLALALESCSAAGSVSPGIEPDGHEERSPYPGLAAFTEADAEHFFGREAEVEELRRKLASRHLLALIGPSGAGKTSFLRAGLAPALPEGWHGVLCTPGDTPLAGQAGGPAVDGHLVPGVPGLARALSGGTDGGRGGLRPWHGRARGTPAEAQMNRVGSSAGPRRHGHGGALAQERGGASAGALRGPACRGQQSAGPGQTRAGRLPHGSGGLRAPEPGAGRHPRGPPLRP